MVRVQGRSAATVVDRRTCYCLAPCPHTSVDPLLCHVRYVVLPKQGADDGWNLISMVSLERSRRRNLPNSAQCKKGVVIFWTTVVCGGDDTHRYEWEGCTASVSLDFGVAGGHPRGSMNDVNIARRLGGETPSYVDRLGHFLGAA